MTQLETSILSLNNLASIFTIIGVIAPFLIWLVVKCISLKRRNKKFNDLNPSLEVLGNYQVVWKKTLEIFESELREENNLVLKNFGLDLERILPDLGDYIHKIINSQRRLSFSYSGLIINPESELIKPLINGKSNIQKEFVISSYKRLQLFKEEFKQKNIQLEVRSYDFPSSVHGIMINDKYLFLGFTEITDGKLFGADRPYIYLKYDQNISATRHYFTLYNNWFDYYWNYEKK